MLIRIPTYQCPFILCTYLACIGDSTSSKPGEIHSAGLSNSTSLTLLWSRTGYCIVIPTGCLVYPICASYRLTKSMTQYCHWVESPHSGGSDSPIASRNPGSTDPPPEDSLATS